MASTTNKAVASDNRFLTALPSQTFDRILPHLEPVALPVKKVLHRSGAIVRYIYFPDHAVVSLLSVSGSGAGVEVGLVGNEGIVGITALMGAGTTPNLALVQIAARGVRMKAEILRDEFKRGGVLQDLLLYYTQVMLAQVSQVALCNRLHKVEQRLCCWLLEVHDRVPADDFPLTQEFISYMLGTRRTGVSEASGHLQQAGLISYSRGNITILDRPGLEAASCECYRAVRKGLDRLQAEYRATKRRT